MQRALIVIISFALAACQDGAIFGGPADDAGEDGGGGGAGGGGAVAGDLPCDVATLLSAHCTSCHGAAPSGGAPMALTTRAQLAAQSPIYSGQTNAQRSLVRMQQMTAAMPPAPSAGVPAAEVTAFSDWITAGMPAGSCNSGTGGGGGSGGGAGGGGGGGPADSGVDGLPCDVATFVQAKCTSCHSSPTSGGAPYSLTSYADFTQAAPGFPGQTVAQRSLVRVQDTAAPMPPAPNSPATAAEISAVQSWVNAGTPAGSCGNLDGGTGGPYPTTCASGSYWTGGDSESPRMNPGLACVACHQMREPGKAWYFMGTVYPAFHEKDLCNAAPPGGGVVEIYDANGNLALTLTPNSAGNFYSSSLSANLALPYTARVVANGMVRAMVGPQTSGDCNTCHTEQGASGAPGRITWP